MQKAKHREPIVPDSADRPALPKGWYWATLDHLAYHVTSGSRGWARYYSNSGSLFVRVGNFNRLKTAIDLQDVVFINPPEGPEAERTRLQVGDLLITITADVGMVGVVDKRVLQWREAFINQHVGLVRLVSTELSMFLAFALMSERLQSQIRRKRYGATKAGLGLDDLRSLTFPLPPLPEQHRIVAAIETQFTRLDAAVTALQRVQANLKRYRASVLQAACEGRLVLAEAELARAEGRSYESADQLPQRILQERRAQWEAEQLAHMQARGKAPKDERWKSKYKEPVKPDTRELPNLPEGWVWTNLSTIAELKGGITKGQKRKSNDILHSVPYLRVANVQRGFLDLTDIKQIEATEDEIKELRLSPGDILFNEGGDRDKLGRGWVWRGEISNCIHQNHVFRARLYLQDLQPKFVSWYGNSCGQQYFMNEGKQTTNLASINLTKLGALPVPLPPLPEQHRIVAEVDRRLSVIDELDAAIAANLKRAERLRQAILKRAFEGTLVPQDPTDEPASVLLERIRAERVRPKATPTAPQKSTSPPRTVQPPTTTPVQGEFALHYRA